MGMAQAGERLRLALEPLLQLDIVGDVLRQDLDGDESVQTRIAGFVDFSHAALTEQRNDFVRPKSLSYCDGHESCGDYARRQPGRL